MTFSILIKNGKAVIENEVKVKDILVLDGKIHKIEDNINTKASKIIDASGKVVIPGGVDIHTHFNLHAGCYIAQDNFYTGTVAAACGGTTTIVDHIGFGPEGCGLMQPIEKYHEYADGNSVVDFSFHGVFQHVNEKILNEIPKVIDAGITSFKAYMVYDYALGDEQILKLMLKLKKHGGLLAVHCENNKVAKFYKNSFLAEGKTEPVYHAKSRNDICEAEAVNRMICLSKIAGNAPLYIVHVSSKASIDYIKLAQMGSHCVIAETCPQYLLLDESLYYNVDGMKYILTPPLRKNHNLTVLWNSINREYISTVASDHCPFNYNLRKQAADNDFSRCPNGLPGVETRIPLMFSEGVMNFKISLKRFVEINCTNPAKVTGLYPKKGVLREGSDADIVIIDPDKKVTLSNSMLHQNVDYTPYEGFELQGYPVLTMSNGEIIVENNKFLGQKGRGKFLKRKTGIFE
ncbi:MAG: dihydropyrimidinase [Victivallales bacterium]|nr:dihydropyrimidinase [Victivallales bacterium]